jgi:hypothetical protein
MISRTRRLILLSAATLACATLVVTEQFGGVCRLEAVTLDGEPMENWSADMGLQKGKSLLDQPLDELAGGLLIDEDINKVDISYRLPNALAITTNDIDPVTFVVSERTGKLYGLDVFGRVVPLRPTDEDFERPVLVNAGVTAMFEECRDSRVSLAVGQLNEFRSDHTDLFRLIAELDFTNSDRIVVTVSGLPVALWVAADRLSEQMDQFVDFVEEYGPALDSVTAIDMRYPGQIVLVAGRK